MQKYQTCLKMAVNDYHAITFRGENNFIQQLLVFIRHVLDLTADLRDAFVTCCVIG